jgi:flavodoxin
MEDIRMNKTLVASFSASGTTEAVAKKLAEVMTADFYEIKPEIPYTKADLDWMDKESRSTVEMEDRNSRPALVDKDANISQYDTIFIGFPIWWYVAPTIINTFLESYDFSGKKIVLFATSGGSGFGKTMENLKVSVGEDTQMIEGKVLNGRNTTEELKAWINTIFL